MSRTKIKVTLSTRLEYNAEDALHGNLVKATTEKGFLLKNEAGASCTGAFPSLGTRKTGKNNTTALFGWRRNKNRTASALPTFPDVVLWRDTLDKFNIENTGKYRQTVCMEEQFTNTPQRLKAIYRLLVHNKNEIEISSTEGVDRFSALSKLLYNTRVADALLDRTSYMQSAAAIARNVSMRKKSLSVNFRSFAVECMNTALRIATS